MITVEPCILQTAADKTIWPSPGLVLVAMHTQAVHQNPHGSIHVPGCLVANLWGTRQTLEERKIPGQVWYCTCHQLIPQGLTLRPTRGIVKCMEQSWPFPPWWGNFPSQNPQIFFTDNISVVSLWLPSMIQQCCEFSYRPQSTDFERMFWIPPPRAKNSSHPFVISNKRSW